MIIDRPRPEDIQALRKLWKQAFGDDDAFLDAFFHTCFSAQRCRCVTVDGSLVGALYWMDCTCRGKKMAYLYAIATDPEFRGKGICRGLMENTHRHLQALGYAGAILVPGEASLFAMYSKMGYACFGGIRRFSAWAEGSSVALRLLKPEEYAALRRQMLPEGSVLQEGQMLAFLGSQLRFYAGGDFLLAAGESEDGLFVPEFLGNQQKIPGILQALGKKEGAFRVPGETPFSMYRSLSGEEPPRYFGLAMD